MTTSNIEDASDLLSSLPNCKRSRETFNASAGWGDMLLVEDYYEMDVRSTGVRSQSRWNDTVIDYRSDVGK